MKTLLISFFAIIITLPATSQINWLATGAKWTYYISFYGGYGLTKLEVTNEDTVLGNHIYKKLLSTTIYTNTGMVNSPLDTFFETSYAYEENNVVYGYEPNLFPWGTILYDFNRTTGDTLEYMLFGGQSPNPFVIDSLGTLDINGSTFAFQDINFQDIFNPGQMDKMRVVQGLGSINSYFFHSHTVLQPVDGTSYYFRCYEDPNVGVINLSSNQVDCDYIEGVTSTVENAKESQVVFPNPADGFVTVRNNGLPIENFIILDVRGLIRIKQHSANQEIQIIDINELERGLYFIIGVDKTGKRLFTEKLAKYGS